MYRLLARRWLKAQLGLTHEQSHGLLIGADEEWLILCITNEIQWLMLGSSSAALVGEHAPSVRSISAEKRCSTPIAVRVMPPFAPYGMHLMYLMYVISHMYLVSLMSCLQRLLRRDGNIYSRTPSSTRVGVPHGTNYRGLYWKGDNGCALPYV